MACSGSIPFTTSTPISSAENSTDQFDIAVQSALTVIDGCIANSQNVTKFCRDYQRQVGGRISPRLQSIIGWTLNNTKEITKLKRKIVMGKILLNSPTNQIIKREFNNMMNNLSSMSTSALDVFNDLLCLKETTEVRSRIANDVRELSALDPNLQDEKTRKFMQLLADRNKKVISCLDYFYSLLPKIPEGMNDQQCSTAPRCSFSTIESPKKLYVLGENIHQKLLDLGGQEELVGIVTIADEAEQRRVSISQYDSLHRHLLSGFLVDDNGSIEEVRLELEEPIGDLIDFSETVYRSLKAHVEMNGTPLEQPLPIVEIDVVEEFSPSKAKVIAIVENVETGRPHEVEVSLVPTTATGKQVHGKILEIHSAKNRSHLKPPCSAVPRSETPCSSRSKCTRRKAQSAKQVFKKIGNVVNALSTMGAAAIAAEASR